ncbi:hypothetical protein OMP40_36355 [Cohnella rhizosphaerae]|uniref:DUF559 domain-containing protein n=2 Tax=Cohnella rhizosphaerae TaxID=1457232 RepID=A0A9X4KZG5_9BACL|nr:hypothetical protein [Cohnella rhizosphaerae]MDG0814144.1 hypothetical protein [Cohnella rhizosphaerae]
MGSKRLFVFGAKNVGKAGMVVVKREVRQLAVEAKASIVAAFIEKQRKTAKGQRLEMLQRDLSGTIKLLTDLLLPVFGSLEGFHLEYEIVGTNGVKIYADVFYEPLGLVFECDGYVPHVELITRDRFSFERMRVRTFALGGYAYFPFSRDELDKKIEMCRRAVYEALGRRGRGGEGLRELPVHERELLRMAADSTMFTPKDVRNWLDIGHRKTRELIASMKQSQLITRVGGSDCRDFGYKLGVKGKELLRGGGS